MPSYWKNYSFERSEDEDLVASFSRLAISKQWAQGSKRYRKEYALCLGSAFEERFGSDGSKLAGWQALCEEVGMSEIPGSITQCRQALRRVYVNLVDLIDARATGQPVQKFKNQHALKNYILTTKKVFPKAAAKRNGFLKALLITVF